MGFWGFGVLGFWGIAILITSANLAAITLYIPIYK